MIFPGIYIISGLSPQVPDLGGHAYFGLAVHPEKRLTTHQRLMARNCHPNNLVQSFYNEYGKDHFYYGIVEQCDLDQLAKRERSHIAQGRTYLNPKGFNLTAGGEGIGRHGGEFYSFEDQDNGFRGNLAIVARVLIHAVEGTKVL